jgi:hypothetical protein
VLFRLAVVAACLLTQYFAFNHIFVYLFSNLFNSFKYLEASFVLLQHNGDVVSHGVVILLNLIAPLLPFLVVVREV